MTLPAIELWFKGPRDDAHAGRSAHADAGDASADRTSALRLVRSGVDAEHALVARVRAGDDAVFGELFHAHAAELIRYATSIVRVRALAEEAVQDAFLMLWDGRATVDIHTRVRAYLFGVVRHRCLDLVRRRETEQRVTGERFDVPTSPLASEGAEYAELDRRIREALATLSPRVREVITLRLRDDLTYPEIAAILGVAQKTVETHMTSALRRLREALADLRPR